MNCGTIVSHSPVGAGESFHVKLVPLGNGRTQIMLCGFQSFLDWFYIFLPLLLSCSPFLYHFILSYVLRSTLTFLRQEDEQKTTARQETPKQTSPATAVSCSPCTDKQIHGRHQQTPIKRSGVKFQGRMLLPQDRKGTGYEGMSHSCSYQPHT